MFMSSQPFRNFLLLLLLSVFGYQANAQVFENAGQYIDYINKANDALTQKYVSYLSGVSHGKSARKVEKRRQELLTAISNTRFDIMGMPPYKGDRTLKDTTVAYLKILNSVFNEDYSKIVNMEEIAEQSYDAMEAYMLAQEKANEKLQQASEKQNEVQKKFAQKNNVNLVDGESVAGAKMKVASAVMKSYDQVYLLFFKSYKQEAYLMEAINQKKINAIEQNLSSLENFSEQGLEKLKSVDGYMNDGSLIIACRNLLNFYKDEAKQGAAFTDFFLKEENFNKQKKKFDASRRTKEDADAYNKAVNEMNDASKSFNDVNNQLNKQRTKLLNDWNNAVKKYMDTYMPTKG